MANSEWEKVEFQEFVNTCGIDHVVKNAPSLLYSKKDRENKEIYSLIAFMIIAGSLSLYMSFILIYAGLYFYSNMLLFIALIIVVIIIESLLLNYYLKSNIYIKPIECWIEVYKGLSQNNFIFYCFSYYIVFSGKCQPNKAKNLIYKLYLEEVLKDSIDITQIEFYIKINQKNSSKYEKIGWFFQYAKGTPFKDENIVRTSWKFFNHEKSKNDNYIVVANWDHQYEWREDLVSNINKLHERGPWILRKWPKDYLKPLADDYKEKINWNLRFIDSNPKIKPWEGDLENQTYHDPDAYRDMQVIDEAIVKIIGEDYIVETLKDIGEDLLKFKSYFRDLSS